MLGQGGYCSSSAVGVDADLIYCSSCLCCLYLAFRVGAAFFILWASTLPFYDAIGVGAAIYTAV